jgi:3-dehydroquinate dehydratase/shikimate dehydrogenase
VATLDSAPFWTGRELRRHAEGAKWVQVRADRVGDLPPSWLRDQFPGQLLYTLRSGETGAPPDAAAAPRAERLRSAVAGHDLVELEWEQDLYPELLGQVPPDQRLISWYGPACDSSSLAAILRRLTAVSARYYQLVVAARRVCDGFAPLEFLRSCGRRDVIAFAEGEAGLWSRVLSAYLGSPLVFGRVAPCPEECASSLWRLVEDYGLPCVTPLDRLYGIAGSSIDSSLSPRLHNAAHRALGLRGLFLPFRVDDFPSFWRYLVTSGALERLGLPLRGLTVASPNKEASVDLPATVSSTARLAGSANLVYSSGDGWVAETTDPAGVLEALGRRALAVAGRRAAVIGCGGSGRAIAAQLSKEGACVTLFNRSRQRGEDASRRLGLPLAPLSQFSAVGHDLVVNATPVGRFDGRMPVTVEHLRPGSVLVDLVYASEPTPLSTAARAVGAIVVDGREVLQIQAMRQFKKMTGRSMPAHVTTGLLGLADAPLEAG